MKKLITDLLTYSMAGIHKNTDFNNCNLIVEQVINSLSQQIEENKVSITKDNLPNIEADPVRLEQLFQNLISNAVKYKNKSNPQIHIGINYKKREPVFYIKDNGIGIASENLERIFNLFTRLHTERDYQGTGIGLAVCKKIVEHYNGKIWVESKVGEGSTFYFTLPGIK